MPSTLWVSIHAPHTERDSQHNRNLQNLQSFNPRAPYGARLTPSGQLAASSQFQSTRPIRSATIATRNLHLAYIRFNPRAPYGARQWQRTHGHIVMCFNPRAPYGARLDIPPDTCLTYMFQSTRPIRSATRLLARSSTPFRVSIHAPHTERDEVNDD